MSVEMKYIGTIAAIAMTIEQDEEPDAAEVVGELLARDRPPAARRRPLRARGPSGSPSGGTQRMWPSVASGTYRRYSSSRSEPRRRRWTMDRPAAARAAASGAATSECAVTIRSRSFARRRARRPWTPGTARATGSIAAGVAVDRDLELDLRSVPRGELVERARGDELARGEEPDPVAQGLDLAQDVRREQDGEVALLHEPPEQREQLLHARRVDRDRRLVEDQDGRLLDQGVGDAEALAHAAGVRLGLAVGGVLEADLVEQLVDPGLGVGTRDAVELGGVAQVLAAGHAAVEADVVGQVADACA